jgi:hypothetical protein
LSAVDPLAERLPASGSRPRLRAVSTATWGRLGFAALCAAALTGFLVYPTYPNYDSYYALIWGREIVDLELPSFEAYRAPTEHPLGVALGAVLSLLGTGGDRVWIAIVVASFVALVVGLYRLGRACFTPLVGAIAAVLLCTRFDFPFLAARGYIDVPFLALVVWAAVLEVGRPRRGTPVLLLLAAAGLVRPEAWVLAGVYWLWCAPRASWAERAHFLALAAVGPVVWAAIDLAVTGDPLFSLHSTSGLAEELGRQKTLAEVPASLWEFLVNLAKLPVVLGGIAGVALAAWFVPRRAAMPAALLAAGIGTFVMVGVAGLSVIDRYLLVPSLAVMLFAAVALGGWTMLREGLWIRRFWALAALALVLYGVAFTALRVRLGTFRNELAFRGEAHAALADLLRTPAVRAGMRCGPVSVPNHKLIPDVRWLLDAGEDRVVARSAARTRAAAGDPRLRRRIARGVAVYTTGTALFRQGITEPTDNPLDQVPAAGFQRTASTRYYAAYVRC